MNNFSRRRKQANLGWYKPAFPTLLATLQAAWSIFQTCGGWEGALAVFFSLSSLLCQPLAHSLSFSTPQDTIHLTGSPGGLLSHLTLAGPFLWPFTSKMTTLLPLLKWTFTTWKSHSLFLSSTITGSPMSFSLCSATQRAAASFHREVSWRESGTGCSPFRLQGFLPSSLGRPLGEVFTCLEVTREGIWGKGEEHSCQPFSARNTSPVSGLFPPYTFTHCMKMHNGTEFAEPLGDHPSGKPVRWSVTHYPYCWNQENIREHWWENVVDNLLQNVFRFTYL